METQDRRVALVTGAGQGIGRAIARRLVDNGWSVALGEIDAEAGLEAENTLKHHGEVFFIQMDVSDEADVKRAVAELRTRWGRLDGLVNNAGIMMQKPLADLTLQEWNRVLAVNLTGPMLCTREAAPLLTEAGGAVVNIASTRALQSERDTEAYSASKGGVVALTHALAMSLAPHVRVNCISPGWIEVAEWKKKSERAQPALRDIDHEQHPAGRVGRPTDIAGLALWLLGNEAGFVTGANFVVDGGMTRKMIYVE